MKKILLIIILLLLCNLAYSYNMNYSYLYAERDQEIRYNIDDFEIEIQSPIIPGENSLLPGIFKWTVYNTYLKKIDFGDSNSYGKNKTYLTISDYDSLAHNIVNKFNISQQNQNPVYIKINHTLTCRLYSGIAIFTNKHNMYDSFTYNIVPENRYIITFKDVFGKNSENIKNRLGAIDINRFSFTDLGISWYNNKGEDIYSISYTDLKSLADPSVELKNALDYILTFEPVEFKINYSDELCENDYVTVRITDNNENQSYAKFVFNSLSKKLYINPSYFSEDYIATAYLVNYDSDSFKLSNHIDFNMKKQKPRDYSNAWDVVVTPDMMDSYIVKGKFDWKDKDENTENYNIICQIYDSVKFKKSDGLIVGQPQYLKQDKNNEFKVRFTHQYKKEDFAGDRQLYFRIFIYDKDGRKDYTSDLIKISPFEYNDVGTIEVYHNPYYSVLEKCVIR